MPSRHGIGKQPMELTMTAKLDRFTPCRSGDMAAFGTMPASDFGIDADSGGGPRAATRPLHGSRPVCQTLRSRASTRAYTGRTLSIYLVREILEAARWAPSGSNMQPWKVIAVAGSARDDVCDLARRTLTLNPAGEDGDYPVCPVDLPSPFRERRSLAAGQRYVAMGIGRNDQAARTAALVRNYDFWGAPVGLFFVTSRDLGHSQWAHLGMFIQSVVLVVEEMGLGSCVQEAWAKVRESLRRHFGLPCHEVIYCGMALGYADTAQPINALRTTREPVESFATFRGFAE
jgi:nitroreductase